MPTDSKSIHRLLNIAMLLVLMPALLIAQDNSGIRFRETPAGATTDGDSETPDGLRVENCRVDFISQPILAFEEPGVVMVVPKEGDRVETDDIVAALNDEEVLLRIEIAQSAYDAARLEASSDIKIRYTDMQAEVALANLKSGEEANLKQRNVVPEMEIRRRDAEYKAGVLGVENSQHEKSVAIATTKVKEAELKAAQAMLKRLQLKSPITGIVTQRERDEGEYVRAGDPVVRVGQLDRLRVTGRIPYQKLSPGDAYGRNVRITIPVGIDPATGNLVVETFESQIQHVAAEIDDEEMYRVWTEIDNRDDFVVRPGMTGDMMILKF